MHFGFGQGFGVGACVGNLVGAAVGAGVGAALVLGMSLAASSGFCFLKAAKKKALPLASFVARCFWAFSECGMKCLGACIRCFKTLFVLRAPMTLDETRVKHARATTTARMFCFMLATGSVNRALLSALLQSEPNQHSGYHRHMLDIVSALHATILRTG